jgi:hypothetical protein
MIENDAVNANTEADVQGDPEPLSAVFKIPSRDNILMVRQSLILGPSASLALTNH